MTVAEFVRVPPSPIAVIVYCVVLPGHTSREPFGSWLPIPWSIDALEAPVVAQSSFAHLPWSIVAGYAEIRTVGAAGGGGGATALLGQRPFARAVA